jgi:hypothetical protein
MGLQEELAFFLSSISSGLHAPALSSKSQALLKAKKRKKEANTLYFNFTGSHNPVLLYLLQLDYSL